MSGFFEALCSSPHSPETSWGTFLMEYNRRGERIHVIHEGKQDPSFYSNFLRPHLPKNIKLRSAGKKEEVLHRAQTFLDRFGEDPHVIFLVDKDFDDFLDSPTVSYKWLYTTSCYSIENFICHEDTLERVLTENFGIEGAASCIEGFRSKYTESRLDFHSKAQPMMAWLYSVRKRATAANFGKIKEKNYFEFSDDMGTISALLDEQSMYSQLAQDTQIASSDEPTSADINDAITLFQSHPPDTWCRGKQDLWFFVEFLNKTYLMLQRVAAETGQARPTKHPTFGVKSAVKDLGPRAPLPPCLKRFLSNVAAAIQQSYPTEPTISPETQ